MAYPLIKNRRRKAKAQLAVPQPRITQAWRDEPLPDGLVSPSAASVMTAPEREYTLNEVFTPTSMPTVTLVSRHKTTEAKKLAGQLDQRGLIACVIGGSQTGKTGLCEELLQHRNPIVMQGLMLQSVEEFWNRLRDEFHIPRETASASASEKSSASQVSSGVKAGMATPIFSAGAKLEEGTEDAETETQERSSTWAPQSRLHVEEALASSGRPVLVDDFHWVSESVRRELLQSLKWVARRGTLVVLISVQESAFAPLHEIQELRNRYELLLTPEWKATSLRLIARKGFAALNLSVEESVIRRLASASGRNPLLMQKVCKYYCSEQDFFRTQQTLTQGRSDDAFMNGLFQKLGEQQYRAYQRTIEAGPRSYKKGRKMLTFREAALVTISELQSNQPIGLANLQMKLGRFLGAALPSESVQAELKAMSDDFGELGPMAPFRYDTEYLKCVILAPELRLAIRYYLAPKYSR